MTPRRVLPRISTGRSACWRAGILPGAVLAALLLAGPGFARKECVPVEADVSAPHPGGAIGTAPSEEEPPVRCRVSRRRNECRVLAKQIAHFEGVLEMARERDDDLWAQGTERHIARLEARRDRLCPKPEGDGVRIARSVGRFLRAAASAAASAAAAALVP